MKKWIIVLLCVLACFLSACENGNVSEEAETAEKEQLTVNVTDEADFDDGAEKEEAETIVDTINRAIIAKALDIEENARNIRFILSSLNAIESGQIQGAQVSEEAGQKVLDIVAQDGTNYRIYLTGSGSVDAVKNLDTNEWTIQSNR